MSATSWSPPAPSSTLKDLIAAAKQKPDGLSYVSVGLGSTAQLTAERFGRTAGFKALGVPFKGSPEGLKEVIAGRVDFYFCPLLPALALIRDGKVDALAVSSSDGHPCCRTFRPSRRRAFPTPLTTSGSACWRPPYTRRHCRPSARGSRGGARYAGAQGPAGKIGRRADADDPQAIRRLPRQGSRAQCSIDQGRQSRAQTLSAGSFNFVLN